MWSNAKKPVGSKINTLIGQDTRIRGDVQFSGGLHVDGMIQGNVSAPEDASAVLTLSEKGTIEGEVRVPHVVLNGSVKGDVYSQERIELASQARVNGNVYYKLLEMAIGATVNGNLVHSVDLPKPMLSYERDAAQGGKGES